MRDSCEGLGTTNKYLYYLTLSTTRLSEETLPHRKVTPALILTTGLLHVKLVNVRKMIRAIAASVASIEATHGPLMLGKGSSTDWFCAFPSKEVPKVFPRMEKGSNLL